MVQKEQSTIDLNTAYSLYQEGKLDDAQELLSKLLQSKNASALTWYINAIVHVQKGEYNNAVNSFIKSIEIQPIYPDAHNNAGVALEIIGNQKEAIKHYKIAIKQRPDYVSALFNLGNISHKMNDQTNTEKYYLLALKNDPQYIKAYNNLGLFYQQNNMLNQAKHCYQNALRLNPSDFEVLNNLGYLCSLENNNKKALELYQQAIHLNPRNPEILNNIGIALQSLQRYAEAEKNFKQAIKLQPTHTLALTNLGNLYKETGNTLLAKENYQKVLKLNPLSLSANNNLGLMFYREGNYDNAKKHYEAAIQEDNTHQEARYNLGTSQIASGSFAQGWGNYLYRPSPRHQLATDINSIDLADLAGKHILLLNEQGIGDELFFLRFAPELNKRCSKLTYLSTPKITPLIRQISCLNSVIENKNQISDYDIAISIGDIPALLASNETPHSIHLEANLKYETELKEKLAEFGPPPYIGITWRGGQKIKDLLFKSVPIDQLLKSIESVNGTFISIQRQPDDDEREQLNKHPRFSSLPDLSELNENLPKMVTLLTLLDDYIGVSNTNMHLRAAVDKTSTVLIPHPPEWRWMLTGDSSPWFPGFNVLRQTPEGNWMDALSQLSQQLKNKYGRSN